MDIGGLDLRDDGGGPEVAGLGDRVAFAEQLTLVRSRAGKSIRALARELDQPPATIGGYFSGQHLPGVAQTELFRELLRHMGIVDQDEIERWVGALARVRRKPGPRPAGAPVPYRGLEAFGTDDAAWFFGREVLTDAVVRRAWELVKDPDAGTMLAVVGPSGSGKSSILRAGVIPAIVAGRTGFGPGWEWALLSPGADPTARLAAAMARTSDAAQGLVLVVDQFEEVFTTCVEGERSAFLDKLDGMARARDDGRARTVLILGMRADFYGAATAEPVLVPVLQDNQLVVGPMTVDDVRRAICEPARAAGLGVEDELVELLVAEIMPRHAAREPASATHEPGALPLLSHALLETWRRSRRGRLTVADYQATGGIAGAVQQTAERLHDELDEEDRALARRLFLRLVNVDDAFVVTRRRLSWQDLPGASEREAAVEALVDRFVAARLLTVEADSVEVSHEALLTAWPRLREWVDADRAGLRTHRQLGEGARIWVEHDRDPASLLRGARLEAAHTWASSVDHRQDLNAVEADFLDASSEHARREAASTRRRQRRLQALLAFVAALALISGSLTAVAVRARTAATHTRDVALSRQLAIQATRLRATDPSLATQLALAA